VGDIWMLDKSIPIMSLRTNRPVDASAVRPGHTYQLVETGESVTITSIIDPGWNATNSRGQSIRVQVAEELMRC